MRLLATTHTLEATGASRCLVSLLVHLRDLGWEVDLLLGRRSRWDEEVLAAGVRIVETANIHRYDVGLANCLFAGPKLAAMSRSLPAVFWVHEGPVTAQNLAGKDVFDWFACATRIVFQTHWQAEATFATFLNGIPRKRIHCIPAGTDPRIQPSAGVERRARHIVFVGSVYQRKRPGDLIHATVALAKLGATCDFVGSLQNYQSLPEDTRRLAEGHPDRIRFVGEVAHAQVIEHLSAARLLCLPSMDDSLPSVIPEAALAGAPAALSDLPGYHEVWTHGINTLLSPVGQIDVLTWNLRALLLDDALHARLLAAAQVTARELSRERMLRDLVAVLEAAAAERKTPPTAPPPQQPGSR
ncbi:MAG: glycosyltransferase family 4 protein [Panacagrimonas sp.]